LHRPEVQIVQGSLKCVKVESRSLTYDATAESKELTLSYDFLVMATGLHRLWPVVPKALSYEQYVADAEAHVAGIEQAEGKSVIVIGGGKYRIFS